MWNNDYMMQEYARQKQAEYEKAARNARMVAEAMQNRNGRAYANRKGWMAQVRNMVVRMTQPVNNTPQSIVDRSLDSFEGC